MLNLTTYIIAAFATYYLSYSISNTEIDGPFNLFRRLRDVWTEPDDWKARGIRCVVCVSCWVALAVTIGLVLLGHADAWDWPIVWLSLAGGSVVLARYWQR